MLPLSPDYRSCVDYVKCLRLATHISGLIEHLAIIRQPCVVAWIVEVDVCSASVPFVALEAWLVIA